MKKFILFLSLFLAAAVFFTVNYGQAFVSIDTYTQVYYIDRRLHRLIPMEYCAKAHKKEKQAAEILQMLAKGRNSDEILTIIPQDAPLMSVHIHKNNAVVDIPSEYKDKIPKNSETERLFIYQIVNSLTSMEGVECVTFTINGQSQKDFLGFLDMREIFIPDYFI